MSKQTILKEAAEHRAREVMHHQINIDNYRAALEEIHRNHADRPELTDFVAQLESLLSSSLVEQLKETIMLTVIQRQLES